MYVLVYWFECKHVDRVHRMLACRYMAPEVVNPRLVRGGNAGVDLHVAGVMSGSTSWSVAPSKRLWITHYNV